MRAVFVLLCAAGYLAAAAPLKKVLILDIKNQTGQSKYSYLELSITDAIKKNLKAKFAFKETPPSVWKKIAEKNFLTFEEDYHTRTFAMQIGLLGQQDVVLSGFYRVDSKKAAKGVPMIVTSITIFNMSKRKVLSSFEMQMPADSTMFSSIDKIAARVSDEAKAVLPDKGDFQHQYYEPDKGPNALVFMGGMSQVSVPTAFTGEVTANTDLLPSDVQNIIRVGLEYRRFENDFLPRIFRAFYFFLNGQYGFGSVDMPIEKNDDPVAVSVASFSASAGLGVPWYPLRRWVRGLYISPHIGGGYYLGTLTVDYSSLIARPLNSNGEEVNAAEADLSAPQAHAGIRLGFEFSPGFAIELGADYRQLFYDGDSVGSVFATGTIALRF